MGQKIPIFVPREPILTDVRNKLHALHVPTISTTNAAHKLQIVPPCVNPMKKNVRKQDGMIKDVQYLQHVSFKNVITMENFVQYIVLENVMMVRLNALEVGLMLVVKNHPFAFLWPRNYGEMMQEIGVLDSVQLTVKIGSLTVPLYKTLVTVVLQNQCANPRQRIQTEYTVHHNLHPMVVLFHAKL